MPSHSLSVIASGAFAALTVDLIIYPLDTLKTRLQSASPAYKWGSRSLLRGGYQGVGPIILATLPASAAFFTTYEALNRGLKESVGERVPVPLQHSISSAIAECLSCGILCPAEVIKQKAQVVDAGNGGSKLGGVTRTVIRELVGKPGAFFSGYLALVARNLPFTAMQFPLFEYVRKTEMLGKVWMWRSDGRFPGKAESRGTLFADSLLRNATAAAIAASIASALTTPVDLVKTRVMIAAGEKESERKGYRDIVGDIWRKEGMRGFWRGGVIRVVWMALGSGLYLGTYEGAKVWLGVGEETAGHEADGS